MAAAVLGLIFSLSSAANLLRKGYSLENLIVGYDLAASTVFNNLLVNLSGIPVLAFLIRRDFISQQSILDRMKKGSKLSQLRLKVTDGKDSAPFVLKLVQLRKGRQSVSDEGKRVVIVAATLELLESSMASAYRQRDNIKKNDLLIVPLCINYSSQNDATISYKISIPDLKEILPSDALVDAFLGIPVDQSSWSEVITTELESARKQSSSINSNLSITLVIKKNGKVGSRRIGVPLWESLIDDVETRRAQGLDVTNI